MGPASACSHSPSKLICLLNEHRSPLHLGRNERRHQQWQRFMQLAADKDHHPHQHAGNYLDFLRAGGERSRSVRDRAPEYLQINIRGSETRRHQPLQRSHGAPISLPNHAVIKSCMVYKMWDSYIGQGAGAHTVFCSGLRLVPAWE